MPKKKYFINPYSGRKCLVGGAVHKKLLAGQGFFSFRRSRERKPHWMKKHVVHRGRGPVSHRSARRTSNKIKGGQIPLSFIPPIAMMTAGLAGALYGKLRK